MGNKFTRFFEKEDNAKSRLLRELGRENSELVAKVRELKEHAAVLEDLLDLKEQQAAKLRKALERHEAEEMSININEIVDNNEKQVDAMSKQISGQISELSEKFESQVAQLAIKIDAQKEDEKVKNAELLEKLEGAIKSDELLERIEGAVKNDELMAKLDELSKVEGRNDVEIIAAINENVHNESVKCYRNIQATLEEIEEKLTNIENKKVSITGTTACVVITLLVSIGNLALIVLRILGIV